LLLKNQQLRENVWGLSDMSSQFDRRTLLKGIGSSAAAIPFSELNSTLRAQEATHGSTTVKALVFDTFGTIVDWRSSVIEESAARGKAKGLHINWADFADRWRLGYGPAMNKVRKGEIPWTRLDDLHRMILEDLLKEFGIKNLTEQEIVSWSYVWRRLKPWPDSVEGLARLKKKYIIAPLSNGNIALMANLAKFGSLPWDAILGAELVKHYKPDNEVYLSAPYFLGLKPEEVMMCAAHVGDLKAARSNGLRTAFIARPHEFGDGSAGVPDKVAPGDFDIVSVSTVDLAKQLGG
jgi:2-haloacid dehalogenase